MASASKHRADYEDVDDAMALWRQSTESALDARGRHGERVLLLTYEQLVRETERRCASWPSGSASPGRRSW